MQQLKTSAAAAPCAVLGAEQCVAFAGVKTAQFIAICTILTSTCQLEPCPVHLCACHDCMALQSHPVLKAMCVAASRQFAQDGVI